MNIDRSHDPSKARKKQAYDDADDDEKTSVCQGRRIKMLVRLARAYCPYPRFQVGRNVRIAHLVGRTSMVEKASNRHCTPFDCAPPIRSR